MFSAAKANTLAGSALLLLTTLCSAQNENYVAKFNANGGTANSSIFDNGNVGIGTTGPLARLDVQGAADETTVDIGSTNSPGIRWRLNTYGSTGDFGLGFNNGNWSRVMTLRTSGNVGIGTTTPSQKLEVNGWIQADGTVIANGFQTLGNISSQNSGTNTQVFLWADNNVAYMEAHNSANTVKLPLSFNAWGGNVGIGTTSPSSLFEAKSTSTTAGIHANYNGTNVVRMDASSNGNGYVGLTTGSGLLAIGTTSYSSALVVDAYGNIGIGTTNPARALDVVGDVRVVGGGWGFRLNPVAGELRLRNDQDNAQLQMHVGNLLSDGNLKLTTSGGGIVFPDSTTQTTAWTGVLCGGDYAESVGVSGKRTEYEPGDVMVIDPANPENFLKSSQPYATTVAGIYSTKPGAIGRRSKDPEQAKSEIPMAMIGIVPTKVSTENGPVKVGDLLVTSSTPGYAMKGTDRMQLTGAIVGKALGSINNGNGVINVLVTLQ